MQVTTKKGVFSIEFRHVAPRINAAGKFGVLDKTKEEGALLNHQDAGTYCKILEGDFKGTVIAQGQSTLHPLDRFSFDKEKGRKIALRKALKPMYFSKEERQKFWDVYLNRPRPVTPNKKTVSDEEE